MFRRAFAFALLFLALAGISVPRANAATNKHAAFVVDVNSGAVLHNDDGDAIRHPASLTKMMTLYLTFELLESGRLKMSDMITISEHAASVAPSKLDLKPGDQISVADGIKAIVTKSANDIAVALAEKIGGTEANFVRLMNTRARELGMMKSHFENPSGLPDDDHVSTARDMATLALHLMDDFPGYYTIFATRTFTYRGKSYRNHNTMLNTFAGVDGIKTGYTRASGFNLVTSVHRGGRHLVGVVFGGSTAASRNAEMRVLLTKAFTRASTAKTRKPMLIAKLRGGPKIASRPASRDPKTRDVAVAEPEGRPAKSPRRVAGIGNRETPIQIFKVKHVPLAAKPAAASADETTDMQDTDGPAETGAVQTANADRNADAGFLAAAERLGRRAEMLGASDRVPATEPAPIAKPVAFAPASAPVAAAEPAPMPTAPANRAPSSPAPRQRGLPPSTLNAQASALTGGPEPSPPPAQSAQRQVTRISATSGGYEVQIGAYGSIADAQRALNSVQDRAKRLLAGVPSVTHPGTVNGKQIFRARFAGFDADRAASTCTELRRKGVDCFVMAGQ
ncbi:D-alanyl-D-alanine carboxypeptidase [Hyphomicrobium denitrificans]|uniref:D-alanyl-D-alanine carboxypeptidase n=1 Tax=Hyphomicrobium denitrificans TaxID=53399 RepID=UPI0002E52EF6|nr:D-alanyl-D-alanine carboxypeptidase [Hyphomicrobium denitrificans]